MSPLNELGTPSKNSQLISVTTDTSQDTIGPFEPLEQSEDSSRHSLMAACSSAFDFGVHPAVEYDNSDLALGIVVVVSVLVTAGMFVVVNVLVAVRQ